MKNHTYYHIRCQLKFSVSLVLYHTHISPRSYHLQFVYVHQLLRVFSLVYFCLITFSNLIAMDASSAFVCVQCKKSYSSKDHLVRHAKIHTTVRVEYPCRLCVKKFSRKDNLLKHEKNIHGLVNIQLRKLVQPGHGEIEIAPQIIVPDIPAGPSNASEWVDDGNDALLATLIDEAESAGLYRNTITGKIFQFQVLI